MRCSEHSHHQVISPEKRNKKADNAVKYQIQSGDKAFTDIVIVFPEKNEYRR
jgi:hypothetical protein